MKIVKASHTHLDQLIKVVEEYRLFCGSSTSPDETREFFSNLINSEESVIFIAINDSSGEIMGFVNLYPSYSTLALKRLWILNDLGVSIKFRSQGIAKALIEKVISFARSTGAVRIELKTDVLNNKAQNLYRDLGFESDKSHVYYRVPL